MIYELDYKIAYYSNLLLNKIGPFTTPVLKFITMLGNYGFIFILTALVMVLFTKTRKAGVLSIISMFIGIILVLLFKNIIRRDRPFTNETSDFFLWWKAGGCINENGFSFPSGHTTSAMAFGFSLFLCFNKKYSWLFLLIPVVMGFSRIYFMLHYFSDVIGGFIFGIISSLMAFIILHFILKIDFINKIYNLPSVLKIGK